MIQKFRKKTVGILTIIFWGTLIGILLAVNWSNYRSNWAETRRLLTLHLKIVYSEDSNELPAPIDRGQKMAKIYSVMKKPDQTYAEAVYIRCRA